MENKSTVWDPLRKKDVTLTPEEHVRQWCIGMLASHLDVPMHLMMSEAAFMLGGKRFRADILVYDRQAKPLMVVECKRTDVELDGEVLQQAIRYNMVLNVKYILITNGVRTCALRRSGTDGKTGYVFVDKVPSYNEMICQ